MSYIMDSKENWLKRHWKWPTITGIIMDSCVCPHGQVPEYSRFPITLSYSINNFGKPLGTGKAAKCHSCLELVWTLKLTVISRHKDNLETTKYNDKPVLWVNKKQDGG